jgi:hypothetical protein
MRSASERCGLSTSALCTLSGSSRRSVRQSVVLPVPTSPTSAMSPFWLVMP